jgi:hypothetical protein
VLNAPLHITGNPTIDWIIFGVGALFCLYWLRALRLAREGARLFILNLVKAVVVFVMITALRIRGETPSQTSARQVIALIVAILCFGRFRKRRRSRYIPTQTRRAVIKRDLKGERFDPRLHHIDHVWPFSKGGSNTSDNLRVIGKEENLRKGAKRPRMRELW